MQTAYGGCSWSVSDVDTYPILTVVTHLGSKSTHLGGSNPESLARILAREINAGACPGGCD
jgi:hypothetical protein